MINVSASVTRRMKTKFPGKADIFHHIPNGANHVARPSGNQAGATTPGAVERFGLAGLRYAICVGRLVPEKRFEDAIAAFDSGGTGFDRLVIVGGAEDESPYRRKLETYAGKDVIFTGTLPRDEVDQLLASAGLFILPSSHEGLPIVALEAIAANVPVLLSNIEPNLDIKLPAQNYFRVYDVKQIASKMHSDVDDFRIGPNFIERYDWQTISRQTSQVYERVRQPSRADHGCSLLWSRLWPFRR
jgi:glycosyltransferase involved in cell wall biosynthesis